MYKNKYLLNYYNALIETIAFSFLFKIILINTNY